MQRKLAILFQNQNYSFWFFLAIFLIFRNLSFFVLFFLAIHYLKTHEDPNEESMKKALNLSINSFVNGLLLSGIIFSVVCFFFILIVIPHDILEYVGQTFGSFALIPDRFDLCVLSDFSEQSSKMKTKWIENRELILTVYFCIALGYAYTSIFMPVYFNFLHRNYEEIEVVENKRAQYFLCFVTILALYVALERLYWPQEKNCSAFYGLAFMEWFGLVILPYLAMCFWYLSLVLYKNNRINKRKTRV